jgi:membrane fusion protein (multidrug efflux system)
VIDDGAGSLVPGMFAEARIAVAEAPRPVVPKTALRHAGSTWRAFVVADGVLEERVVQIGADVAGDRVAIVKGLAAGDKIANPVTEQIADGLRVE